MGLAKKPLKVKLFTAIMYAPTFDYQAIVNRLAERFGPVEYSYGPTPFLWSEYYSDEMGMELQKVYLSFEHTIDREILPSIKNLTNDIEAEFTANDKRTVNIDPGYISRDKLVLASTKDFYHRLYLSDGIYGEVTLHYRKGVYRFFSWTYPDYREEKVLQFLERGRAILVKELRRTESDRKE